MRRTIALHSITLRLALWYAASAFVLIAAASLLLYAALQKTIYREDLRTLADYVRNTEALNLSAPRSRGNSPGAAEAAPGWATPQVYLRFLDRRGRVLRDTAETTDELPAPSADTLTLALRPEGYVYEVMSRSGRPLLVRLAYIAGEDSTDPAQFVQVALDRSQDTHFLADYRRSMLWILTVSLLLCAVTGAAIARFGLRPIRKISITADEIRSKTLHKRIDLDGLPGELLGVAKAFNAMLDRLQSSFQQISQFSENVAHELRTPINNMRGELEVTLGRQRPVEDYRAALASSLEECDRITRLVDSLLFLARTEVQSPQLEREIVDLSDEITTVEEFFGASASEAGIELRVSAPAHLPARVHRTLFQQALGNLLSNALAHTPRGGTVTLAAGAGDGQIVVTVADTGSGIPEKHLPRIFERFYRVNPGNLGSGKSAGLGLAVVKRIMDLHRGDVRVKSEVGAGTSFSLVLPASFKD